MATRILLADDSITIQKVVELTFSEGDFEVLSVSNGQMALDRIGEWNPDIALLDVIMPEKSGYEVCHEIKQNPRYRDLPVLLLTGTFEPFDPERARTSGSDGHITKPFESRTLIAKVEELLAAGRSSRPEGGEDAEIPEPSVSVEVAFESESDAVPAPELAAAAGTAPEEDAPRMTPRPEPAAAEETPDWVAGDFGQDLPSAAEIERGFGTRADTDWRPAPETPDPLLKTGMTQAFPLGGVGLDQTDDDGPVPEPASGFGRTMAIEVPQDIRDSAPADIGTAGPGGGDSAWEPPARQEDTGAATVEFGAAGAATGEERQLRAGARPFEPREPEAGGFPEAAAEAHGPATEIDPEVRTGAGATPTGGAGTEEVVLSQESIDSLARRVVEKLSDQIVREIAWEVVPDLAETLIRKRIQELEEKIGD